MKFKRENRYAVFKLKNLTEDQRRQLYDLQMELGPDNDIDGVVVESHWPEYEPVWHMIESRIAAEDNSKFTEERTIKTMNVPVNHNEKQSPMVTNTMKRYCMGAFEWTEDAPFYDENGELHQYTATHTVPWNLCKKIYKQMATMANASPELEQGRVTGKNIRSM